MRRLAIVLLMSLMAPVAWAGDRQETLDELARLEIEAMRAEEQLRAAVLQDREQGGRLAEFERELADLEGRRSERQGRMALRLRAMYRFRHRGFLPLLFSADSPHELLRSARYLWWIVRADQRALDAWQGDLERTDQLSRQVQEERDARHRWAGEVALRREDMRQQRTELEALLGRVRDPVNRRRIRTLLQEPPAETVDVALDLRSEEPPDLAVVALHPTSTFERSRGRLPLPVMGPISRVDRGVDISADEGTPIRAVHPGVVDRVQHIEGLGLVLILSHGDGWHTVYGHAAGFDVRAGAEVTSGEVIGRVGATDSLEGSRLHFQLLHQREAEDPFDWLMVPPGIRVTGR
jgi:murein hydrolase activator